MRFETTNYGYKFKLWNVVLSGILTAIVLASVIYFAAEIPKYREDTYSPIFGYGYFHTAENFQRMKIFTGILAFGIPCGTFLSVLIIFLSKWGKDAKKYGLMIDDTKLFITCDGKQTIHDISSITRFDIMPKGFEPRNMRSKWTDTAIIEGNGVQYCLFYLENVAQAKQVFETNKERLQ